MTSRTHGGKAKSFEWSYQRGLLRIANEDGIEHEYSSEEIATVLTNLFKEFGKGWIPLANNVEKMYKGIEIRGFGTAIYDLKPGDSTHAQGSSYLGVVLEEINLLEWNREKRGIKWRIIVNATDVETVRDALEHGRASGDMPFQELLDSVGGADQIPYTLETHKHNFAIWAAARAIQRGFRGAKNSILGIALEDSNIRDAIYSLMSANVVPEEFDVWHKSLCRKIIKNLLDAGVSDITYGRAAKLVAIYLKVTVIIGEDPTSPLARVAHPPIDHILLQEIAKENPIIGNLAQVKWTNLTEEEYFDVVNKLRSILDDEAGFWQIEKYWNAMNDY